jgi:predicted Rossmann-fold nucleotide-binding protein
LLNVENYYAPLLELFDHAVREGFLSVPNRQLVLDDKNPERLLKKMAGFRPKPVEKWIANEER